MPNSRVLRSGPDPNIIILDYLMGLVTTSINKPISDTLKLKVQTLWKETKMDYTHRRDTQNCNPNDEISYDDENNDPFEHTDPFERGLSSTCLEAAKPFKELSNKILKWMNKWNKCGDNPQFPNGNTNLWKDEKRIRKMVYKGVGCVIKKKKV